MEGAATGTISGAQLQDAMQHMGEQVGCTWLAGWGAACCCRRIFLPLPATPHPLLPVLCLPSFSRWGSRS